MKVQKFTYIDAHYSYIEQNEPPKGEVISFGEIVEKNKDFTHIKVAWSSKSNKIYFGLVIPKGCFKNKPKIFNINQGETVGVYWNDIFSYNEEYTDTPKMSSMYTEGVLSNNVDGYVFIHNPETIDSSNGIKNHPEKKALIYCIPHGMITDIKKYERKN